MKKKLNDRYFVICSMYYVYVINYSNTPALYKIRMYKMYVIINNYSY